MGKNWNCISIMQAFPRKARHGSAWNATPHICEGLCPVPPNLFHFHHLPSLETFCPNNSQPPPSSFSMGALGDWGCLESGEDAGDRNSGSPVGGRSHLPSAYRAGWNPMDGCNKVSFFSSSSNSRYDLVCSTFGVGLTFSTLTYLDSLQLVVTPTLGLHQLQVTSFGLFSQGLVAEQGDIGTGIMWRDHCFALEDPCMCANASPQPFSKCLRRNSHKTGCIDPKMQSKSFESKALSTSYYRDRESTDAPREGRGLRAREGTASSLLSWRGEGTAGRAG